MFHSDLTLCVYKKPFYPTVINIDKLLALYECLQKWKPFLVSCIPILEPCTNFRGLEWGMDFGTGLENLRL